MIVSELSWFSVGTGLQMSQIRSVLPTILLSGYSFMISYYVALCCEHWYS
jgi:hypothetical protein